MIKTIIRPFMAALLASALFACDGDNKPTPTPEPGNKGSFHIWTPLNAASGMSGEDFIVVTTPTLTEGTATAVGNGVELKEQLNSGVIMQGKYAYCLTKDSKFGKYIITPTMLETVKQIQIDQLKDRRFCHAWLDDNTLVLMGSDGPAAKINWVKIDTKEMRIIANGALALPAVDPKVEKYNTSGMLAYRKADNMLIYLYCYKPAKGKPARNKFYAAFIDPADMSIKATDEESRAVEMGSSAFGELRQDKSFFDEKGDYYLSAWTALAGEGSDSAQRGHIFRIKAGQKSFDKSYSGYNEERGKIVTMAYLGNGKVILYMQDPLKTIGKKVWDTKNEETRFCFYFITLDLATGAVTDLNLPYGTGNFVQPFILEGEKCYIAVNQRSKDSQVMIYDLKSGKITPGLTFLGQKPINRLVKLS